MAGEFRKAIEEHENGTAKIAEYPNEMKEAIRELKEVAEIAEEEITQEDYKEPYSILKIKDVGILNVKSPVKIKEAKLVYENVSDWKGEVPPYKIFEFLFGVGQFNKYLITPQNKRIPNGESYQYIKPVRPEELDKIDMPSAKFIFSLAKKLYIKTESEDDEKVTASDVWEKIKETHFIRAIFYKPCLPISEESFQLLKGYDSEKIKKIINFYLTEGNDIDERILLSSKAKFLKYHEDEVAPEHIMPYNPHTIECTNPKTTKSTVYSKIGLKRERASMAGSLGFSTGNETNKGDLDGVMESYAHDEIQEENKTNVIQQTLTVMETGIAAVAVGRQTVHTATCATLSFLTNPKEIENTNDFFNAKKTGINAYRQLLEKLSDNYRAFGSRIGIVNFGNDFRAASGARLDYETYRKLKAVITCILDETSQEFTKIKLHPYIQEWMNADLPESYKQKIRQTIKNMPIREVKEFWEGHTEAYRHIRGGAINLACLDFIMQIWEKNYNPDDLLVKAEEYLVTILINNEASLMAMAEIAKDYLEGFNDSVLENCEPDYLKYFILVLLKHLEAHPEAKENYIVFDELKDTFNSIQSRETLFGGKYSRWNELRDKFTEVKPKQSAKLYSDFGIQSTKVEGICAFQIINFGKLSAFYATKLYNSLGIQSSGVNGVSGLNGVSDTPNTPETPVTPMVCSDIDFSKLTLKEEADA